MDCKRHRLRLPKRLHKKHIDLKEAYADARGVRPCGLATALSQLRLPYDDRQHPVLDDVGSIARIARIVLVMGKGR